MQHLGSIVLTHPQSIELRSGKCYDIAVIGAGISAAYTLIHYISQLEQQSLTGIATSGQHSAVKIVVTEKSDQFWTGMPYGNRSGCNALLISSLKEFIPQQLERENFTTWLTENRHWIFDPATFNQGELSRKWLAANSAAMSEGLWDELFIPRYTFGLYLRERIATVIDTATAAGLVEVDLLTVDVRDIQHHQDLYRVDITAADGHDTYFISKKVVLTIGSPPNVAFEQPQSDDEAICYIDNMYHPSLDANIDRICKSLAQLDPQTQRQVLIVGSNAGTLDTLYSINNSSALSNLIDKFIILSPNAAFPHRINRGVQLAYEPQSLLALVAQTEAFTAKQIYTAVEQDIAVAVAQNINISDIYADITKVVMQALNLLNFDEQKQFVSRYAVEIGKLQRRAGGEYLDVVDNLIAQHKLEFLKGRFVKYSPVATGANCEYIHSQDRQQKVFETPINVIINCGGFQDVTKSSSVLIQNLLERKICVPNESSRGLTIDRDYQANHNFYVMGPLIAGNIDGNLRVWHAESCQRIISLSQQLAAVLLTDRSALAPVAVVPSVEEVGVLVSAA